MSLTPIRRPGVFGVPLLRFLDTVGDGSGTIHANADFSVTPATFLIRPAVNQVFFLNEFTLHLADNGTFGANDYGAIAPGTILVGPAITAKRDGVTVLDLTNGEPINTNNTMFHLTSRVQFVNWSGGADTLAVTFNSDDFGTDLILYGSFNDTLEVALSENYSGLTDHHFLVRGYY
jgi:hypothetical protein